VLKLCCEQPIKGVRLDDPEYPVKLECAIDLFNTELTRFEDKLPLYREFIQFLQIQHSKAETDELKEYLSIVLLSTFKKVASASLITPGMYQDWYLFSKDRTVLGVAVKVFPNEYTLWKLKINSSTKSKLKEYKQALQNCRSAELYCDYLNFLIMESRHDEIESLINDCDMYSNEKLVLIYFEYIFKSNGPSYEKIKELTKVKHLSSQVKTKILCLLLKNIKYESSSKKATQFEILIQEFINLGGVESIFYKEYISWFINNGNFIQADLWMKKWQGHGSCDYNWYRDQINH
jgi:hypothetical protein